MDTSKGRNGVRIMGAVLAAVAMVVTAGCGTVTGVGERGPGAPGSDATSPTASALPGALADDASGGTATMVPFPPSPASSSSVSSSSVPSSVSSSSVSSSSVSSSRVAQPSTSSAPPAQSGPGASASSGSAPGGGAGAGTGPAPTSAPPGGLDGDIDGAAKADPVEFAGLVSPVGFQSPSGNIQCGFQPDGSVVCSINTFTASAPTVDCQGHAEPPNGVSLDGGSEAVPRWRCLSDVETGGPTLPYGSSLTVDGITCASQRDGVTCVDTGSGNGFRLARESYQLVPDVGADAASPTETDAPQPSAGQPPTHRPAGSSRHQPSSTAAGTPPSGENTGSSSPLAGNYFSGAGAYNTMGSDGNYYGVVFLDDTWAYWGRPKGGLPHCTKVTATATPADEPGDGWGCAHYSYDAGTGAVKVGSLRGTYTNGQLSINDFAFRRVQIPSAGTTFNVVLENEGYAGMCGPYGGCSTWSTDLALGSDGKFVLSNQQITSMNTPGVGAGWSSSFPPDQHGTYRVGSGARITLSFADGTTSVRTIAVDLGKDGKPDPSDASGSGGLIVDALSFWRSGS